MTHKQIATSVIIPIAVAAILIVPWVALQRSYAQSDIANTILKMHNDERASVSVPPLVWSNSLAADAKSWAQNLATRNQGKMLNELTQDDLVHATGTGQGENLSFRSAWGTGQVQPPSTESLVSGWIDEKPYMGGHYTQMVWKNTKEVGCAIVTSNGKTSDGMAGVVSYLVCRYNPPGNMAGEKPF